MNLIRRPARQASSALWRIALVRMGCHQPAKDYVAREVSPHQLADTLTLLGA